MESQLRPDTIVYILGESTMSEKLLQERQRELLAALDTSAAFHGLLADTMRIQMAIDGLIEAHLLAFRENSPSSASGSP
jgi:hypothetical protein